MPQDMRLDYVEAGKMTTSNTPQGDSKPKVQVTCKHRNIWLIAGGLMCWCYECGAFRPNAMGKNKIYWQPPTHKIGSKENPAMKDWYPALTHKYVEFADD